MHNASIFSDFRHYRDVLGNAYMSCSYHGGHLPTRDTRCRLFDLGFPRTGSRSVCVAVRTLGIFARHGFAGCGDCERDAISKAGRDVHFDIYKTCDYLGNINLSHWKRLVEVWPDSRFIMPIRPLDSWLTSQHKHRGSMARALPGTWKDYAIRALYGTITFDRDQWRECYASTIQSIRSYFANDSRLFEVNVFEDSPHDFWNTMAAFCDREVPKETVSIPNIRRRLAGGSDG